MDSSSMEFDTAATIIQSAFRGYVTRASLSAAQQDFKNVFMEIECNEFSFESSNVMEVSINSASSSDHTTELLQQFQFSTNRLTCAPEFVYSNAFKETAVAFTEPTSIPTLKVPTEIDDPPTATTPLASTSVITTAPVPSPVSSVPVSVELDILKSPASSLSVVLTESNVPISPVTMKSATPSGELCEMSLSPTGSSTLSPMIAEAISSVQMESPLHDAVDSPSEFIINTGTQHHVLSIEPSLSIDERKRYKSPIPLELDDNIQCSVNGRTISEMKDVDMWKEAYEIDEFMSEDISSHTETSDKIDESEKGMVDLVEDRFIDSVEFEYDSSTLKSCVETRVVSFTDEVETSGPTIPHSEDGLDETQVVAIASLAASLPHAQANIASSVSDILREIGCGNADALALKRLGISSKKLKAVRAELELELVWAKQAVESRINYLSMKHELLQQDAIKL